MELTRRQVRMFVSQGKVDRGEFRSAFELDRIPYTAHVIAPHGSQAHAKQVVITIIQEQGINIASINGLGEIEQLKPFDYMVVIESGHIRAYKYRADPPKTAVQV